MKRVSSRRQVLSVLGGLGAAFTLPSSAHPASVAAGDDGAERKLPKKIAVTGQEDVDSEGCVPCSVFNSLSHGPSKYRQVAKKLKGKTPSAKVLSIIGEFGGAPSEAYAGHRTLFSDIGVTPKDTAALANAVIKKAGLDEYAGQFLDRRKIEEPSAHVRRVHDVLTQSDKPPIISLKTFKMARSKDDTRWVWNYVNGHTVTVLGVDPLPTEPSVSGFMIHCADSVNAAVIQVFLHPERNREFSATRDFTVGENGELKWQWRSGFPYLLATAPDLRMGIKNCESWQRVVTFISHATI